MTKWVKQPSQTFILLTGVTEYPVGDYLELRLSPQEKLILGFGGQEKIIKLYHKNEELNGKLASLSHVSSYKNSNIVYVNYSVVEKSDVERVRKIIELIDQYMPLFEFRDEIFKFLKITQSDDELLKEVMSYVSEDPKKAMSLAVEGQKAKNFNTIIQLINFFENNIKNSPENAIPLINETNLLKLYKKVIPDHPHFKEINQKIVDLLYTQEPESVEHKILLQEERLRSALIAGPQRLVDQIFNELSGYQTISPAIENIQVNPDTLVTLATQIRTLQQKNNELQKYKDTREQEDLQKFKQKTSMWEEESKKVSSDSRKLK